MYVDNYTKVPPALLKLRDTVLAKKKVRKRRSRTPWCIPLPHDDSTIH